MNYLDEKLMPRKRRGNAIVLTNPNELIENLTIGNSSQGVKSMEKPMLSAEQEPLEFQRSSKRTESSESGSLPIEKTKSDPGSQAKWEWSTCNHELVSDSKLVETSISLSPSVQLSNNMQAPLKVEGTIQLERPLMYNESLGWNWHKVMKLPSIKVAMKFFDPVTNESAIPPSNLVAEFIAVKFCWVNTKQARLTEIKLTGPTLMELVDGQATFTDLKFDTTSYNNDGVKFHLVLIVSTNEGGQHRQKIVYSRISPPIFVDSRKSARDSNQDRCKKLAHSFFDPFSPDIFDKAFVKRNTKPNEEPINNNLEGLAQYFAASNIRNKVKHPIFLSVKFSNCVKLYYNAKSVKPSDSSDQIELDLVEHLQRQIWENYLKSLIKIEGAGQSCPIENKSYILLVEDPTNLDCFMLNKKISDYLEPLQNDVMHIFFNSAAIPSYFIPVQWQNLQRAYLIKYNTILSLKNTYMQYALKNMEEDTDSSSPVARHNSTPKLKKTENGSVMDIENGLLKSTEGSEPRLHKKVKKEFSDISSIDEERKSECSRLSIEQRLAEIKMEDDSPSNYSQEYMDMKTRASTYSHESRTLSLIELLKKKASDLLSVEKARSQTAEEVMDKPKSNIISKLMNPFRNESYESTNSSIHSNMTFNTVQTPNVPKGKNSNLSHYMNNSLGNLVSKGNLMDICPQEDQYKQPLMTKANLLLFQQQQNQQQLFQQQQLQQQQLQQQQLQQQQLQQQQLQQQQFQQLNPQCMKLPTVEAGKQSFMMNQIPQQYQSAQLIDNEKSRYFASLFQQQPMQSTQTQRSLLPFNLNFLTSNNSLEAQQLYGTNYGQLGGGASLLLNNQNLLPTAANPGLGSVRTSPTNHPVVKAALDNINANIMLISKIMESESSADLQKDRCNSQPVGFGNAIPTQQFNTMTPTFNSSQILPPTNLFATAPAFLPRNNSTSDSMDKERTQSSPFPLLTRKNDL